jgi:hypothetical protein
MRWSELRLGRAMANDPQALADRELSVLVSLARFSTLA